MEIVGYCDPLSAAPSEQVAFMVSSREERFRADIVRLRHGNTDPAGPGLRETLIPGLLDGTYEGTWKEFPTGSYVRVGSAGGVLSDAFTIQAWVYPTLVGTRRHGIVSARASDGSFSWSLELSENGGLALRIADASVEALEPVRSFAWYFIAATRDGDGNVTLQQRPAVIWPGERSAADGSGILATPRADDDADLVIGLGLDGKIEAPRLWDRALSEDELLAICQGLPSCLGTWWRPGISRKGSRRGESLTSQETGATVKP